MRSARHYATVAATLFAAFASGHIIQSGETTLWNIGHGLAGQGAAIASSRSDIPVFPRPPVATLQATPFPSTLEWSRQVRRSIDFGVLDRTAVSHDPAKGCVNEIRASSVGEGMVRLSIHAPCNVNEPVTIRHAGLAATQKTTTNGRVTIDLPAMESEARFEAIFQDGHAVSESVFVPEADEFHRVGLTWRGESGLHIHAREFGATKGATGHVWAGAPGFIGDKRLSDGGTLVSLGDASLLNANRAEVYTFPKSEYASSGTVRLSVEAEILNTNCGSIIAAQTVQPDGLGGIVSTDMTLRLPECHAVGETIELKNILRDLKLASN